jgi:opacity protein-like surface antigen
VQLKKQAKFYEEVIMKTKYVCIVLLLLAFCLTAAAQNRKGDQYDPYDKSFFLTARGGIFLAEDIYNFRRDTVILNRSAWFESTMTAPSNFSYGGGLGIFFTNNLGIRFDLDAFSADFKTDFTFGIQNPLNPSQNLTASTTVTGITSNWTLLSADLIFRQKVGSSFVFMIGGGITYFMTDIYVPENFEYQIVSFIPSIVGVDFSVYEGDTYSFNILGTVEYFIDDDIAITAEARYSHAQKEIEVPSYISSSPVTANIGGLIVTAGFMMHF